MNNDKSINIDKSYPLEDLLNMYGMINLGFRKYGDNENGELLLYLKTDTDVSVFLSQEKMSKPEYLKMTEEEVKQKINFKFLERINEMDLDIAVIINKTSDVNIPCGRYTLETLDKLTLEQDKETRDIPEGYEDGIVYHIVDGNTGIILFNDVYIFGNDGFINDLRLKANTETNDLNKQNVQMTLEFYDNLTKQKGELYGV